MDFELQCFDFDCASYYPMTEKQKEECIRAFLLHQLYMQKYKEGQYINKMNYIVCHLGLDKKFSHYLAKRFLNAKYGRSCYL